MIDTAARISAKDAAFQGRQWAELQSCDEGLLWLEFDASQGRNKILFKRADNTPVCLTPDSYSVGSRVHEYGGGSYCIAKQGVAFVNDADQGLYWQSFDAPDTVVSIRCAEGYRYADLQFDIVRHRLIAVEEQHLNTGKVVNRLVAIGLGNPVTQIAAGGRKVLVQGADFYASPRLDHTNSQLAWISWDHPNQPWTSTCLWLGELDGNGVPQAPKRVSSQSWGREESVVQPEFASNGALYFLSDRSGWWNLYRYVAVSCSALPFSKTTAECYTEALLPREAEFCRAPWQLGQRAYVVLDQQRIGCSWWSKGRAQIGVLQLATRQLHILGEWPALHSLALHQGDLLAIAEPSHEASQLWRWSGEAQQHVLQGRMLERIGHDGSGLSYGEVISAEHVDIDAGAGSVLYGLLYRTPKLDSAKAPLIIQLHGGPTAQADGRFDPLKQFWLQRGFVILDLNYRGSTGYGRAYRHSLHGQWGVSDVQDVISAAHHCIEQGWADPDRIVVRGNSAGGYTTLQVLSQCHRQSVTDPHTPGEPLIRTGASLYGISDLERLASETHKFESHYLDWLIGDPQHERANYRLRSPIHRSQEFSRPLIFFQGGLDRVVPATQTYRLYNQLKGRGLAVEYHAFADERHGFRKAKNRALVLEREFAFYCDQLQLGPEYADREVVHYVQCAG